MVGNDGFQDLVALAAEIYPSRDDAAEQAWWAERGVDIDALNRFCAEKGAEDAECTFPNTRAEMPNVPPVVLLGSGFAMAYNIGIILGWLLHERAHR